MAPAENTRFTVSFSFWLEQMSCHNLEKGNNAMMMMIMMMMMKMIYMMMNKAGAG